MIERMITSVFGCALLAGAAIFGNNNALAAGHAADYVMTNGKIYTVNDKQPWAEAVAVKGDEIVYVGDKEGGDAHIGDGTRVIDLKGRLTLPGFIESHVHTNMAAAFSSGVLIDFSDSMEEVLRKVKAYADANPDREVIFGATYNGAHTTPDANYKKMLDDIVPDRPVYLIDHGGHGAWVNSKTLEALGYTRDTIDPPGAVIARLENGEPNGALKGAPAHFQTQYVLPVFTTESLKAAIPRILEGMNEFGFTAGLDMAVGIAPDSSHPAYQELDRAGELTVRLSITSAVFGDDGAMPAIELLDRFQAHKTDRLWYDTLKLVTDGVIELQTSAMLEPFLNTGSPGQLYISRKVVREASFKAAEKGYHVTAHAFGDRAVRTFLDISEELRKAGYDDTLLSISHAAFVDPADLPRFTELNVMYETTPVWIFDNYEEYVVTLGADRYYSADMYPLRDIIDSGTKVALGSDWPATIGGYEYGLNPFTNIYHAMTRSTATSLVSVWGTTDAPMPPVDQAMTLEEAIRGYTLWGAERMGKADMIGSIEVGKKADIIVLDQDLFSLDDIQKTVETKVLLTMFDGQVVHDRAYGIGDSRLIDPDALDGTYGDPYINLELK